MLIHLLPKDASGSIKIPNPLAWMQSEVIGLHKNQILSQRAVKYLSAHQLDTYRESYLELMLLLGRQGLGYLFTSVHLCPTLPISQCFYSLLHPLVWPKGNFKASGWCLGALTLGDSKPFPRGSEAVRCGGAALWDGEEGEYSKCLGERWPAKPMGVHLTHCFYREVAWEKFAFMKEATAAQKAVYWNSIRQDSQEPPPLVSSDVCFAFISASNKLQASNKDSAKTMQVKQRGFQK